MNDLTISLDAHLATPLYEQIYNYIKCEIQNGGLPFRERLPSSRKLADYLQVSRTTVNQAYDQLVSEGYLEAVPQKGYFVCDLEGLLHLKPVSAPAACEQNPEASVYLYDFSPHGVDLNSFPHHAWRKLSKNLLMEEDRYLFRLGDPQGEPELRATIAGYLHQARGVNAQPERIVVGAGNDFLLLLLCSMFGSGTRIAMESPTYRKAYDLFHNLSNDVRIVEMDESGMRVDQLEETGARLAYVMPSHQYPLGTVMPVKRRMQLLQWASGGDEKVLMQDGTLIGSRNHMGDGASAGKGMMPHTAKLGGARVPAERQIMTGSESDRYIIEDDYDSEFRYKGKPIPALQGYDRDDRVIYIGTFSKSIAPSIRVSYMVLPERLMGLYRERARNISSTVSRVDQMLIAGFLNEGYYERHLNKMRAVYRGRHDTLLEELKAFRQISRVSGENAGVHLLLTFTNGMTEEKAIRCAAAQGVRVYGLSGYYVENPSDSIRPQPGDGQTNPGSVKMDANTTPQRNDTVLLGYANLSEQEIREAAARLGKAWLA
ncbi:MAG: PLP-dependent aminotransferase family protein [Lachnospiraceae bacterium]|nr:PLP-dependent aminotransferase family protein [Lachnospiraceae bacterium]